MATTASSIIRRAADQLLDTTSIRWGADELVRYLNDAQKELVVHRPDASTTNAAFVCVAGTKQTLPAAAMKLVNVIRNTNAPKRVITKCERDFLDQCLPGWHGVTGAAEILHYMYDPMDPRVFYVYPPALITSSLEVTYTTMPVEVAEPAAGSIYSAVVGNLGVPDMFANAVLDYILFRAYSKNSKFVGDNARAMQHLQLFANTLGVELKALVASIGLASSALN